MGVRAHEFSGPTLALLDKGDTELEMGRNPEGDILFMTRKGGKPRSAVTIDKDVWPTVLETLGMF